MEGKTMKTNQIESTRIDFGAIQIGIIVLTLATAFIHFSLLFPDVLFILNGLGYLTLLALYFLPIPIARENRGIVRLVFMGYVVITILAWVAIGNKSWPAGALGYLAKTIELFLLGLLWQSGRS
jgi:hypothetical protein